MLNCFRYPLVISLFWPLATLRLTLCLIRRKNGENLINYDNRYTGGKALDEYRFGMQFRVY
jgi:hypothetical protein